MDNQEAITVISISILILAIVSFILYWLGRKYIKKQISHYKTLYQKAVDKALRKNEWK